MGITHLSQGNESIFEIEEGQGTDMTTTITLEFSAEPGLGELEHELKLIHGLKVFLVEPRDTSAPVLLSIAIGVHGSEQAGLAIRQIGRAHV